jgi:uncharacterized membrane protein YeaQ/YmgE (transglycosylase-associated protein family)
MRKTRLQSLVGSLVVAAALWAAALSCMAQTNQSMPTNASTAERVGAATAEATQAALSNVETLWQRIDEKRLKNRTPDELVAWALMGLLVGGLIYRLTKLGQGTTVLLGLVGAFVGGIVANVTQLNLGLGPVLIRYEELICSFIGGFVLLYGWSWVKKRTGAKPEEVKKPAPAH